MVVVRRRADCLAGGDRRPGAWRRGRARRGAPARATRLLLDTARGLRHVRRGAGARAVLRPAGGRGGHRGAQRRGGHGDGLPQRPVGRAGARARGRRARVRLPDRRRRRRRGPRVGVRAAGDPGSGDRPGRGRGRSGAVHEGDAGTGVRRTERRAGVSGRRSHLGIVPRAVRRRLARVQPGRAGDVARAAAAGPAGRWCVARLLRQPAHRSSSRRSRGTSERRIETPSDDSNVCNALQQ